MNYLDSHCHISDEAFAKDRQEVIQRMIERKVTRAMIVCVSLDDYYNSLEIKSDQVSFKRAIGVYPEYTDIDDKVFDEYVRLMKTCDAVGEIGLDYHWYKDSKQQQKDLFIKQIKIAKDLDKPIIVHAREALKDTYDILKKYQHRGVLHCYSGSSELAKEFVKLGYYISIAGPITWKNAKEPLEVIRNVPLERLLIETDCPYLTPSPNRGKRNEPSFVVDTARKIMDELNIDEEKFLKQINENYDSLFGTDIICNWR